MQAESLHHKDGSYLSRHLVPLSIFAREHRQRLGHSAWADERLLLRIDLQESAQLQVALGRVHVVRLEVLVELVEHLPPRLEILRGLERLIRLVLFAES